MNNSIRVRLVVMYVLLVVIVMIVSGTMIILMVRQSQVEQLETEIRDAAFTIKEELMVSEPQSMEDLDRTIKSRLETNPSYFSYGNKRIYLLNTKAEVIYPTGEEVQSGQSFHTNQVWGAIENGIYEKPDMNRRIVGSTDRFMGFAESIIIDGKVTYVVYVLGNISDIDKNIYSIVQIIMISVVVALVIAAVLGFVFSEFITKPISLLSVKVRDIQKGKLDQKLKVYANDEIGQLTRNFNVMAQSLNDTLNEITSEKNKLEIVFAHITDGIVVFDKIGMMIHHNPASVNMLRLDKQISFQEVFRPYLDITYKEMKALVEEETVSNMIRVDNKYYSVYFAKFLNQKNEAVGLIGVIQDITEHKKLEEMQKEFVANVSHELRTPLTTIKSYTETLMDGVLDEKETAERFLTVINHESDRMTALVQDLLELSKLDNSQVKFSMMDLNLAHILSESVDKFRVEADKKNQSLIYHPLETDTMIIGDTNRIEQVIKNMISNAIKYSQEGALVEVSVKEVEKYLIVSVTDNGMGISKNDLKRIFDRFYRVDKARSREMGGTGLGLAIAKEIMDVHGGKIEVTSELGKGTTFELYFKKKLENG